MECREDSRTFFPWYGVFIGVMPKTGVLGGLSRGQLVYQQQRYNHLIESGQEYQSKESRVRHPTGCYSAIILTKAGVVYQVNVDHAIG